MKINQSYLFGGIVLVLVISTLNSLLVIAGENLKNNGDKAIDENTYQAMFLTNNQIYFGHAKSGSSDYVKLEDVYYIQINNSDSDGNSTQNRLVRLGDSEPHGPKNEMIINKSHILFIENLNSNSQVVKAIQSIQLQKK